MKLSRFFAYAAIIIVAAGGAIWYIINNSQQQQSEVTMYKNPGCECCDKWAYYMQDKGYEISVVESADVGQVKAENGITQNTAACHTSIVGDYVVEGHVPAEDIERLLQEQPDAKGLVVPGMPASSPGMNTAFGEPYDVYLLNHDGSTTVFASH